MAKKKQIPRIFIPRDPRDLAAGLLAEFMNGLAYLGIKKLEGAVGYNLKTPLSMEQGIRLETLKLKNEKQRGENIRASQLGERQLKLLDQKIEEKGLQLQQLKERKEEAEAKVQQTDIPRQQVIAGALEVPANLGGLTGDTSEDCETWLTSFRNGKVILTVGKRGTGKTALLGKTAEYVMARFKKPVYWVGLPAEARDLLPSWITLVDLPEQCPPGSFIVIDEAGLQYMSLAFASDKNMILRRFLPLCRQKLCSLIFAVQNTRDLELSILRAADTIIFKQPSLRQAETERAEIRSWAKKAAEVFKGIDKDDKRKSALVFDDDFNGLITYDPPSFWSEALSNVYGNFDFTQITGGYEARQIVAQDTKLIEGVSLEKQILELRRQDHGITKIAKMLDVTQHQVRKVLEELNK